MSIIEFIEAREILDSRGNPTVEVDVILKMDLWVVLRCPPAHHWYHEAVELRDGDRAIPR